MEFPTPLNAGGLKAFNVPGLGEKVSEQFHIASAIVIPPNATTVVTSGQVGFDADMKLPKDLLEEVLTCFQNVVDSLAAAGVQDGFQSVYQMTSYHVGGVGEEVNAALGVAIEKYFGGNRPAWAGVGVEALSDGARIEMTVSAVLKPSK